MIAFKPPLIVQRAEDDKTQSSAEFLAHCCPLVNRATDHSGHGKPWRAKSGVPMIVFKPPLIVQQADDNKIAEAQEGHAQADQTLAGYTQPEYNRLAG